MHLERHFRYILWVVIAGLLASGCKKARPTSISTTDIVKAFALSTPLTDAGEIDNYSKLPVMHGFNQDRSLYVILDGPTEKLNHVGIKFKLWPEGQSRLLTLPLEKNKPLAEVQNLVASLAGSNASAFVSLELTHYVANPKPGFRITQKFENWTVDVSGEQEPGGFVGRVLLTPAP